MPLTCPDCKQNQSFVGSGIKGKMKCLKCNCIFDIDGNWSDK